MFLFIRASLVMLSLHINRNPKTSCQGPLSSTDNTIDTKTRGIDCKRHILMITLRNLKLDATLCLSGLKTGQYCLRLLIRD